MGLASLRGLRSWSKMQRSVQRVVSRASSAGIQDTEETETQAEAPSGLSGNCKEREGAKGVDAKESPGRRWAATESLNGRSRWSLNHFDLEEEGSGLMSGVLGVELSCTGEHAVQDSRGSGWLTWEEGECGKMSKSQKVRYGPSRR